MTMIKNKGRAILTVEQVKEIRHIRATTGKSQEQIARKYGVTRAAIQAVVDYRSWKNI